MYCGLSQMSASVLPDGIFSSQNSTLGKFWKVLLMEDVGIFIAILSILRPNRIITKCQFGTFCGHMVYFSGFGML
jgi:hypothetical protein